MNINEIKVNIVVKQHVKSVKFNSKLNSVYRIIVIDDIKNDKLIYISF